MKYLIFLVSGNGGNLKFINESIKSNLLPDFSISCVIADRDCGALEYAKHEKIKSFLIPYSKNNPHELRLALNELKSNLIITNIHKILDVETVNQLKGKLINLHYSLLPLFKGFLGEVPVKKALEAGCTEIGNTVHFVEKNVDEGKIISQGAFDINEKYSFKEIMEVMFKSGCLNLLNSMLLVSTKHSALSCETIKISDIALTYSPGLIFDCKVFDEKFWSTISKS